MAVWCGDGADLRKGNDESALYFLHLDPYF